MVYDKNDIGSIGRSTKARFILEFKIHRSGFDASFKMVDIGSHYIRTTVDKSTRNNSSSQ